MTEKELEEYMPIISHDDLDFLTDEEKIIVINNILDKIRAEIENDWQLKKYPNSPFSCGLRKALDIIDKYRESYKAESEEYKKENYTVEGWNIGKD